MFSVKDWFKFYDTVSMILKPQCHYSRNVSMETWFFDNLKKKNLLDPFLVKRLMGRKFCIKEGRYGLWRNLYVICTQWGENWNLGN